MVLKITKFGSIILNESGHIEARDFHFKGTGIETCDNATIYQAIIDFFIEKKREQEEINAEMPIYQ